jgi:hypothetical protein
MDWITEFRHAHLAACEHEGDRLTLLSGLGFPRGDTQGTAATLCARTATTLMVAESVMMSATTGEVTLDAATVRGSWRSDSTFAGITTATPMVTAVMATAAMPQATRETDDS